MQNRYKKVAFALMSALMFLGISESAFSQVTTGSMSGSVFSRKEEAVVGARVVATHRPTGSRFGAIVSVDGRYLIRNMKVGGPYVVKVSFDGGEFQSKTIDSLYIELGQNLNVNVVLEEKNIQTEEIVITADRNTDIDRSKTGAQISIPERQIKNLPTIARDFTEFARLSPQFNGNSAGGRNNRYNNIQIDGAVNNDLFGLAASGTPGGQASTSPISLDAIQEFQVLVAPYDVRQGGFTGGLINAITRSGTNKIEGSVFSYGRNQTILGNSPDGLGTAPRDFRELQAGFRVGGPIIQDQLFLFVNGEITDRVQPRNFFVGGTGASAFGVVQGVFPNGLPADSAARFENALRTLGYETGTNGSFDVTRTSQKLFGRIDWNISDEHKLTLRHNYVNAADDNDGSSVTRFFYPNSYYAFKSTTNSTVLQLNSVFGKFYNEFLVNFTTVRDRRETPGSTFPRVQVNVGRQTTGAHVNSGIQLYAGTEEFSGKNSLDQDVLEITDNFTTFLGAHTITLGTHNEFFRFKNLFLREFYGAYEFNGIFAFEQAAALAAAGNGRNLPSAFRPSVTAITYGRAGFPESPIAELGVNQFGFYAQDEWAVSPKFTLTYGIRVDMPFFTSAPFRNDSLNALVANPTLLSNEARELRPRTDVKLDNILWSPRVGFNYDVTGDKEFQIRGGIGVFTGRTPYVWMSNNYGNTGVDVTRTSVATAQRTFFLTNRDSILAAIGNPQLNPNNPQPATEINVVSENFKFPQLWRTNLAVDYKLPAGFVFTGEAIYSKIMNDPLYKDLNLRASTSNFIDGRPLYGTPLAAGGSSTNLSNVNRANTTNFTNIIFIGNTDKGYTLQLTGEIRRTVGELTGGIAYTYSQVRDVNSVTSSQAISNWRFNVISGDPNNPDAGISNFELRHRFVANINYEIKWNENFNTNISLIYVGREGRPFSYRYQGDLNGDGQAQNDLVYVPSSPTDRIVLSGDAASQAAQWAALDAFISRDPALVAARGSIIERNAAREPWNHQLDLRLTQGISFIEGQNLELTFDLLNVLNFINNNWGRLETASNQNFALLTLQSVDAATGFPVVSFNTNNTTPFQVDPLLSRWSAQFGLRYSF